MRTPSTKTVFQSKQAWHSAIVPALLVLCCGILLNCSSSGGGTLGTSGRRFEGVIANATGEPQASISVTILESGESASTNSQGQFAIEDELGGIPDFTLELRYQDIATTVVGNLGESVPQAALIELQIELDTTNNQAQIIATRVTDKTPPTPRPTGTDSPSSAASSSSSQASSDSSVFSSSKPASSEPTHAPVASSVPIPSVPTKVPVPVKTPTLKPTIPAQSTSVDDVNFNRGLIWRER